MQKLVWINGNDEELDLTSGDYGITEWNGFADTDLNIQSQQVPFQDGSVFLDALLGERQLSVTLAINDDKDLEKRYRLRRELIHRLNPKLGEGYLIYTNDFISKRIKCVPKLPLFPTHNSDKKGTPKASLSWTACDPYWEDLEETEINFGIQSQPVVKNNGDVPTQVKIDFFTSGVVNPKITNLKTKKLLEYNGNLTSDLQISTELGKKYAVGERVKLNSQWITSLSFLSMLYSENFERYYGILENYIYTSKDLKDWSILYENPNEKLSTILEVNGKLYAFGKKVYISEDGNGWEEGATFTKPVKKMVFTESLGFVGACSDDVTMYPSSCYSCTSLDGATWQETHQPRKHIIDLCYSKELEKILAIIVCFHNLTVDKWIIADTVDGETWNEVFNAESAIESWSKIGLKLIYGKGKFVTFGGYNFKFVLTSVDGLVWDVIRGDNIPYADRSLCYSEELNLYGACDYEGRCYYSEDGILWNKFTYIDDEGYAIQYSLEPFCYTGIYDKNLQSFIFAGGNLGYTNFNDIWEITNDVSGIFFPSSYCKITDEEVFGITLKLGLIIENGKFIKSTLNYSPDISGSISSWRYGIVFAKGVYVYVFRINQKGYIYSSTDRINWELRLEQTYGHNDDGLYSVCYSKKLNAFFAIGSGNDGSIGFTKIYKSVDGITWENIATIDNIQIYENAKIIYSEEKELLVFTYTTKVYLSNDGITWTEYTNNFGIADIIYVKIYHKFYALSSGSPAGKVHISEDCINWTDITVPDYIRIGEFITFSKRLNMFLVGYVSYDTFNYMYSYDGITWKKYNVGITSREGRASWSVGIDAGNQFIVSILTSDTKGLMLSGFDLAENQIQNISADSDMNFNLEVGDNQLRLNQTSGSFRARVSYRQKYLGV